jgi:hypothetical protein
VDLQRRVRHRLFVGRATEIATVLAALSGVAGASEDTPRLFLIHGLGGVGKTGLLEAIAARATEAGAKVTTLDGRDVTPTSEGFAAALAQALGRHGFGRNRSHLLLVDTVEKLRPLERWLRETFLPGLPVRVVTVLATREPPSAEWRSTAGWGQMLVSMPLANLDVAEAREVLERHGVPRSQHDAAVAFTHGHPLALCLVADLCAHRGAAPLRPHHEPELIGALLRRFVEDVQDPVRRRALEAASVVRSLTEPLLGAVLGHDAHEVFVWLRELSFMRMDATGLFPHDVVREALVADLRWRDAAAYALIVERAHVYYAAQIASGADRDAHFTRNHLFLSRFAPGVGEVVRWADSPAFRVEVATEGDVPALIALVRRHEGDDSAAIAAHWFARQLDRVLVVRDASGAPAGLVVPIALERVSTGDLERDPAARAAHAYVRSAGRLRKDDRVVHFRFWMAAASYQAPSEAQSVCMMTVLHCEVTTPNLARSFWPCRHPEAFADVTRHSGSTRLPEADFTVGGHTYGVYSHDWRHRSRTAWLANLARAAGGAPPVPPGVSAPLDEPMFRGAVLSALKAYLADHELAASPLLGARLVMKRTASGTPPLDALRRCLREAVEALGTTPRGHKLGQALTHTYLDERSTQEAVAEALDLPFSTYRRHLTAGAKAVADWLWSHEHALRVG